MPVAELEAVLWAATALVVYSYAGYPVLLALLGRLFPAPLVKKQPITPPVTVLIVAHDEEQGIGARLDNLLALDYPADRLDVLVASDGSTDRTDAIVAAFAPERVRLLRLPGPAGKATALDQAVPLCRGEVVVLGDARQRWAADAVRELVASFADPSVGAVSGELHIATRPGSAAAEGVGAYWKLEKWIRRMECELDSTVGVTGAIYAIRKDLFLPIDPRTVLDDVAIPMNVVLAGRRVLFEPAARAFDVAAETPAKEYRRKVRTLAGNYQLVALNPRLLDPFRNRLFWQLLSHKLTRLAVPWCLLAILLASALLAGAGSVFYGILLVAQLAFYGLALGGARGGGRAAASSRLIAVPYAFVLLNLAAAAGLVGFLTGSVGAAWKTARP